MLTVKHYAYSQQQLIGKGSTGSVYLGTDLRTKLPIAIKVIDLKTIDNQVVRFLLEMEKQALQSINSPYVLRAIDIVQNSKQCCIITEYCQRGTLQEFIKSTRNKKIQEKLAIQILRKLAIGLASIAGHKFLHRDLKTANIMLRNNLDPVIIDFGYCQNITALKPSRKYNVGSPAYMSPEAYMKSFYSQKSDVWALGIIFHQMLTSKVLDQKVQMQKYFASMTKNGRVKLHKQFDFSNSSLQILEATLKINSFQRISAQKLVQLIATLQNSSSFSDIRLKQQKSQTNLTLQNNIQRIVNICGYQRNCNPQQIFSARVQRSKSNYLQIGKQYHKTQNQQLKEKIDAKSYKDHTFIDKIANLQSTKRVKEQMKLSYFDLRKNASQVIRNTPRTDKSVKLVIRINQKVERPIPRVATVKNIDLIKQRHIINIFTPVNAQTDINNTENNKILSFNNSQSVFSHKFPHRKNASSCNQSELNQTRYNQRKSLTNNQSDYSIQYHGQPFYFSTNDMKICNKQNVSFSHFADPQLNKSFNDSLNKTHDFFNERQILPQLNFKIIQQQRFCKPAHTNQQSITKQKRADFLKQKFKFKNRVHNSQQKLTISTVVSKNKFDGDNIRKNSNSNSSFSNYNQQQGQQQRSHRKQACNLNIKANNSLNIKAISIENAQMKRNYSLNKAIQLKQNFRNVENRLLKDK